MKAQLRTAILLSCLVFRPNFTGAEILSFATVWQKARQSSPAQEAARFKTQSAEAGFSRAGNHWLPRVYVDAKSYRTNDPGASFFGLLEQRKVGTSDFIPDSLNHPEAQTYTRGALGVDLALYEGGSKQAQVQMLNHTVTAEKLNSSQLEVEEYGQAGVAYGTIASLRKQKMKLLSLNEQVSKLVKGYQLGQKSNPAGYSGLLGMKSLAIRIAGLIDQLEAEETASYRVLSEMGIKDKNWAPQDIDARTFTAQFLSVSVSQSSQGDLSHRSLATLEGAKASDEASKMEKARYRPRVGAFAESYLFNGSRETSNGYTAGLYLQWNLFDPGDYGKYKEAKLNAMAAERMAQASLQQESAERQGLVEIEKVSRSNLTKLDESEKLLAEQTSVTSTLFKNGSIGALQFVEILNRRTDLIAQQTEAELSLLKVSATLASKSRFEIPESVNNGGGK